MMKSSHISLHDDVKEDDKKDDVKDEDVKEDVIDQTIDDVDDAAAWRNDVDATPAPPETATEKEATTTDDADSLTTPRRNAADFLMTP